MIKIDNFRYMTKIKHFIYVLAYTIFITSFSGHVFTNLNAQTPSSGIPFIQNYSPKEYGSENENFSIVQDNRGVVYIGNENGIIEYDNSSWHHINVPGWPHMDINKEGRVFIGAYNEFGYLLPLLDNRYAYQSLKDKLLKKGNFGLVHNVVAFEDQVFFETSDKLYLFHHDYIQQMGEKDFNLTVFKAGDALFINQRFKGLSLYNENRIEALPLGMFFREKKILAIVPYKDKYLIRTENDLSFWLYDMKSVFKFETEADGFIASNHFTDITILKNGLMAIGTMGNGIVIINEAGKIVKFINQGNGLYDNYVHDLYADNSNNIWACLKNGFSRIEFPASYSFLGSSNGIKGSVSSIHRFGDNLFVGTINGVYAYSDTTSATQNDYSEMNFRKLSNLSGIAYGFFEKDNKLFTYTSQGIYEIDGKNALLKYKRPVNVLKVSQLNPNILYVGCPSTVRVLKYDSGEFEDTDIHPKINGQIRSIAEDALHNVWFGTNYYGLYMLKDANKNQDWSFNHFEIDSLLPTVYGWIDVFADDRFIYFSSEIGVYAFDPQSWKLTSNNLFGLDFSRNDKWLNPVVYDSKGNVYYTINNNTDFSKELYLATQTDDSLFTHQKILFQRVNDISIETIYPDKDGIVWLGGAEGLTKINTTTTKPEDLRVNTFIKSVTLGIDSILYINPENLPGFKRRDLLKIKNDINSIKFSYVCPSFTDGENIEYTFFLENYDENWSDWGKYTSKEYTSLPAGKYTFFVKARDIYSNESNAAKINFVVLAPFYFTTLAFIIYAIVLITFSIMLFKVRSYQFAKEKSKLERIIKERTEDLVKEFERAEDLLVNMLPQQTAHELKTHGKASTRKFDLVSVMFSDIQGFTEISELIDPDVLVSKLDEFFQKVDAIIGKYQIEKIKTIGDGYMCAGGIPERNRTNPIEVVLAALELREFMKEFEFDSEKTKHLDWGLRIGIHTGPAIAGVIGDKKLSYDVWGVTVNNASRMESNGLIERVNISQSTYELVKDYFDCEYYGTLTLKSGNITEMYFVNGLKDKYAADQLKVIPNKDLIHEIAEIRFQDLYDFMIEKLTNELPSNLYYHNLKHTIDVTNMAEVISQKENANREEQLIIRTAALLHDSGFCVDYDNHEFHSVKIAKEILPVFNYNVQQIEQVGELIMATKFPPIPKNHLEEIICDADLDYLGRKDFIPISRNLFIELYERKKIKSVDEWLKIQINFIEKHSYFTDTAKNSRDVNKNQQLDNLRQMYFLSSFF